MKKLLLLVASLLFSTIIFAQTVPAQVAVEKSTNKVKIDGKVYYVHIVKQHETLYSISKAYSVSQSEIATANPDIYSALKVGQALKIPVNENLDEDDRYIYHIVKRKETLYSISKEYNISQEDLIALNPVIKEGLKKSQLILIPKKGVVAESSESTDSVSFIMHEVQKGEGLYAISRVYGVSTRDIELYNRQALAKGVQLGSVLRIPIVKQQPITQNSDFENNSDFQIVPETQCVNTYNYDGRAFNISMLLPFTQVSLNELNDISNTSATNGQTKRKSTQTTQQTLEFYEGFLLAVDSMKTAGVSVNLNVFDTKKQPVEVNSIINGGALNSSDLIISPFFIDEILPVANFACRAGINMVSPSYNGPSNMPNGKNIITVNQSFKEQFEFFMDNLAVSDTNSYLVVYDTADTYSSSYHFCDSILKNKFSNSNINPKYYYHRIGRNSLVAQDSMFLQIDSLRHNVIIVPSEDEPFISEILGNIYGVKNYHKLATTVYGPSRWRRMKNISPEYLYNLNLFIYSPFFVDYKSAEVQSFVENYREVYRAEPSQLSFLGYDVGIYFISALKKFGTQFNDCLPTFLMNGLQMDFAFKIDSQTHNLQNTDQIIVKYTDDFEIVRYK